MFSLPSPTHAHSSLSAPAASPEEAGTSSTSFGSFRQLLTSALPSEVQRAPESPSQLSQASSGNTRNKDAGTEPQEMSALEALQIERARIHGTLVSYLHCGWERDAGSRSGAAESTEWSAAESKSEASEGSEFHSLSGNSEHSRDIKGRQRQDVTSVDQPHHSTSQALHADEGQVGSPIAELAAAPGMSQPLSSRAVAHSSRRAEAMALLEGGGHSSSTGCALRVLGTSHFNAVIVAHIETLTLPTSNCPMSVLQFQDLCTALALLTESA